MKKKLIETAFPLKEVSEHSKGEKGVWYGHINHLHRWPARRPMAASRAVIIASLLDDPKDADEEIKKEYRDITGKDTPEEQRKELCNMISKITKWKTENGPELVKFKNLIIKTYGKSPKLIDPFSGGGSIPLEALRLGCEVTANDYNPVAAFILKCTLDFPQKFRNKKFPFPDINLQEIDDDEQVKIDNTNKKDGDMIDHIELWGKWILEQAKKEIGHFFPEVDEKKTVAYLWARTVPCQDPNCRGTVPLLKTLLLCNKQNGKLRALKLKPNIDTKKVEFDLYTPKDKNDIGKPIMSRANAKCPFCGTIITPEYIKNCGNDGTLNQQITSVVYETDGEKEYRQPTEKEIELAEEAKNKLKELEKSIQINIPDEPLPKPEILGMRIPLYGFKTWGNLFTDRQLLSIMTLVKYLRETKSKMKNYGYDEDLITAIYSYLAITIDKIADFNSTISFWNNNWEYPAQTFSRYALPMTWDFSELNIFSGSVADYKTQLYSVIKVLKNFVKIKSNINPIVLNKSADEIDLKEYDFCGITDPPYYDAIPYSDISDFFYVWLKRIFKNGKEERISDDSLDENEKFLLDNQVNDDLEKLFLETLTPKNKELVAYFKDNKRPDGFEDRLTKLEYENGMAGAFKKQSDILINGGIFIVVFANKEPDAWETLVNALIKANFTITASLPLDTERSGGLRNNNRSSLSTSIWMVCRKRSSDAGKGKHQQILKEMKERISDRLRYFWDEGVRGPDFVWSAIGPALESYSKYEIVKRPDGKEFTVSEFLTEVRRIVTDFALGEILKKESTEGVDVWTSYYLMHRYNFGYESAPAGECILLSQAYGLDLNELSDKSYGILKKTSSKYSLLPYNKRNADKLGEAHTTGILPYIDMLHKLMIIWKSGDTSKLNEYISDNALKDNDLFWRIGQSVLEMCDSNKEQEERSLLESIVSWGKGSPIKPNGQQDLFNNV